MPPKRKNKDSAGQEPKKKFSPNKPSTSKMDPTLDEGNIFEESEPSTSFKSMAVSDSSMDNKTPGKKRSLKRMSMGIESPQLPMNDDGTELIEEEVEGEKVVAVVTSQEAAISIEYSMTLDQMKEHVSRCLELNTENKINAKNAFALRLIDCMTVLSKSQDEGNFAAMACQLDAGAKIYSLRVDTVHQQVMKLVESCIFTEKQAKSKKAGEDTDSDDEADHDQPGTSTGTTKGKKWKRKKVLASHDQITRALKENDPKDKYFKCEALPGGIFNQVRHDPKDLSLTLAKDTPFWINWTNYKPIKAEEATCEVEPIVIKVKAIGPNLEGTIDASTSSVMEASYIEHSMVEPTEPVDNDDDMFNEPDTDMIDEASEDSESKPILPEVQLVSRAMERMSQAGNKDVSRLDALKAVFHKAGENDYQYLKKCNSKYWAGPKKGIFTMANKKKPGVRKKKERKAIVYSEDALSKPLDPINKRTGLPTKRKTTLSGKVFTKWKMMAVTNQPDIHFERKNLLMLFHVELEMTDIFHEDKNQNEPLPEAEEVQAAADDFDAEDDLLDEEEEHIDPVGDGNELSDDSSVDFAGFPDVIENADATQAFLDFVQQVEYEGSFNGFPLEGDNDGANEGNAENIAETAEGGENVNVDRAVGPNPDESSGVLEGDNLVPMVKIVNVEPIKYSVKPHRVDMGHLKKVMFSTIIRMLEDRENEMKASGQNQGQPYIQFRDLLTEVMNSDELDHRTRADLSVAMVLLTLLFITNEHNLRLENAEGGDPRIFYKTEEEPATEPEEPDETDSE